MTKFFLLNIVFIASFYSLGFTVDKGSLCVASMPGEKAYNGPNMTSAETYVGAADTIVVQVGKNEIMVSPDSGGKIYGLSLDKNHLVQIKKGNSNKVSFWFDFKEEGSSSLCLWYYKGYGTFSLLNTNDRRCNCN